jgi:biotin synthase
MLRNQQDIVNWLREENPAKLETLFQAADTTRLETVGKQVHLRGLIEFSNYCRRSCLYCGIRRDQTACRRYRMTPGEILASARFGASLGLGTIVLQSGEDPALDCDQMAEIIRSIKDETGSAVTLSLGERTYDELERLKDAGADRYLIRFETANQTLYRKIHPPLSPPGPDRLTILSWLRDLGYEIGSGIMVGIPGESYEDLANDIETFRQIDLDMIGLGPYVADPGTPLGQPDNNMQETTPNQVPNTTTMTLKVIAVTRLLCPSINIPSTTALESIDPSSGYESGLQCGANVIMPNVTPSPYRSLYTIYPSKACVYQPPEMLIERLRKNLQIMGREIGNGRGDSTHFLNRIQSTNSNQQALCRKENGNIDETIL